MLREIGELPGSLDLNDEEIYVPRERSVPSPAGAFALTRKISLVFSVGLESSLSKLREVRAPVDPAHRYEGRDCDGKNMAALLARSSVVLLAH